MESSAKVDISFCKIVSDPSFPRLGFPTFVMCSNKSYSGLKERVEDAGIEVDTVHDDFSSYYDGRRCGVARRIATFVRRLNENEVILCKITRPT